MAQLKRQRVLVLERHFRLGGFTHSFTRPGHRAWDVGLHYVGGMGAGEMGRQLFDLVTRFGVRWQKMPSPFEKFVYPDLAFDVPDDEASYRQALIARYPQERAMNPTSETSTRWPLVFAVRRQPSTSQTLVAGKSRARAWIARVHADI